MTAEQQHILRILGEATEHLFLSDITGSLNAQLSSGPISTGASDQESGIFVRAGNSTADGRWMLRRRVG
jgi:hypothetical protein